MDLFASFPTSMSSKSRAKETAEVGCQADRGMSPSEMKLADEYMERCEYLTRAVREERRVVEQCEQALRDVRSENRNLQGEINRVRAENARVLGRAFYPESVQITRRGTSYHVEGCPSLEHSTGVMTYHRCSHCIRQGR